MDPDEHDHHPSATLALATPDDDGGLLHQSWLICTCALPQLRAHLGEPAQESYADAATVRATAQAVLDIPGHVHRNI